MGRFRGGFRARDFAGLESLPGWLLLRHRRCDAERGHEPERHDRCRNRRAQQAHASSHRILSSHCCVCRRTAQARPRSFSASPPCWHLSVPDRKTGLYPWVRYPSPSSLSACGSREPNVAAWRAGRPGPPRAGTPCSCPTFRRSALRELWTISPPQGRPRRPYFRSSRMGPSCSADWWQTRRSHVCKQRAIWA